MDIENTVKIETEEAMQDLGANFPDFIRQKENEGAFENGILKIIPNVGFKAVKNESWHDKFCQLKLKIHTTQKLDYTTIEPGIFHAVFTPLQKQKTVCQFFISSFVVSSKMLRLS